MIYEMTLKFPNHSLKKSSQKKQLRPKHLAANFINAWDFCSPQIKKKNQEKIFYIIADYEYI